ncbi:MMPL family transporter [Streptosporangium sp. NPDC000396]|uniref:MMPL family transporter n=1 Tax=Streptosporangium sp. NPDC000396 TaxID=3366185 RepID=UPI0036792C5F
MFETLGRAVYRGRWSLLVLGVVLGILAGYFGLGLFGRMADGGFEDPGAESTAVAEWSREWFGGSSPDVVALYTHPTFEADDEQFKKDVRAVLRALPTEQVTRTTTYWTTKAKELVSDDRHSTYALITLRGGQLSKQSGYEKIRDQLRRAPAGYTVKVGGSIPLLADLNTQTGADLQQAEAISMPVLLVLLALVFGSLVAAGLPLIVGLLSVAGALFLLRLLTEVTDVSVFSLNVVTMLGLGLAIDYSLFVLNAFREEIRRGSSTETAVVRTLATAGRTVAFSGLTVATSLSGLLLFPQMFLRSIGLGAAAVVLVAMMTALIVLPALLAVLGPKVDAVRIAPDFGRHGNGTGAWRAIASSVMRRPVVYLVGVSVVLIAMAAPFVHARFGSVDHRVLPERFESRQVAEEINARFAKNAMSPIEVIVLIERDLVGPMTVSAPGALTSEVGTRLGPVGVGNSGITPVTEVGPLDVKIFMERLEALDHVTGVDVTGVSQNNGAVRLAVRYDRDPMSDEARALVERIRALPPERNFRDVVVGGPTAAQLDLQSSIGSTLPWTALVVCLMTGLLLFAAFGSILLPIKAILMNVLSLGASFGVIVWAFQDGNLADFLGFTPTGSIEATITVLILAVVFGLSMDYELFLLSRVRAEWLRTGDNTASVTVGLEKTGGLITSAALLLLVVIAAFSTAGITVVKMLGVGMFVAIVVDATLVRALLVPATMRLMGNANWWLPGSLRSFHRRIEIREHDLDELAPGYATVEREDTYVTVERADGPYAPAERADGAYAIVEDEDGVFVTVEREDGVYVTVEREDTYVTVEREEDPYVTVEREEDPYVTVECEDDPYVAVEHEGDPYVAVEHEDTYTVEREDDPGRPTSTSTSTGTGIGAGPARALPAPARRLEASPPRQHRTNPYPLPMLDPEPPFATPAVPAQAGKVRKVVKPNLDGPGWHWAEEHEDDSPPQPLLTVQDAVGLTPRPPRDPIAPPPGTPAASPAPSTPAIPPAPAPSTPPVPQAPAPSAPPVPPAPVRPSLSPPSPPAPLPLSPPPPSLLPALPEPPPFPVRREPTPQPRPARSAQPVSSHLIDQLEPLIQPERMPVPPVVRPVESRPEQVEEPRAISARGEEPRASARGEKPRAVPARGEEPRAVPPRMGEEARAVPARVEEPPLPHAVPPVPPVGDRPARSVAGRPEPEADTAGGWVAVRTRTTRVVRPTPDGSGWEWVEVEE